jgi:hypothetical protein
MNDVLCLPCVLPNKMFCIEKVDCAIMDVEAGPLFGYALDDDAMKA